jgi:hypothetical protein
MIKIREGFKIAVGVTLIMALPTIVMCGVMILMAWISKALGV